MAFTKTLFVAKTASLWQKKLKNNKLPKTTLLTHPHGSVSGARIRLLPLHRANLTMYTPLGLSLYKSPKAHLNYFLLYKYLLIICRNLGMGNRKFVVHTQQSRSSQYLQLL